MTALALLIGFAVGTVPSAHLLGRLAGHNLRLEGTGNPGTANALVVGGRKLAGAVLVMDIAKGVIAVQLGLGLAGTAGAVAGGLAAIAGQILNPWFRFRGGKGLGVTGGVTIAAWPLGLVVAAPFMAGSAKLMGSAAKGAILGLAFYAAAALAWVTFDLPVGWGIDADTALMALGIGVVVITGPKFVADLRRVT
nr:glycerol-3-phosphate acyltransferase [Desulfuromonadales bacterium]